MELFNAKTYILIKVDTLLSCGSQNLKRIAIDDSSNKLHYIYYTQNIIFKKKPAHYC